jgi:hypothetical protein
MVWRVASSLTATPFGVLPAEPLVPVPPEPTGLAPLEPLIPKPPDPPGPAPPDSDDVPAGPPAFELPELFPLEPFALVPPGPPLRSPPEPTVLPPLPGFEVVMEEHPMLANTKMQATLTAGDSMCGSPEWRVEARTITPTARNARLVRWARGTDVAARRSVGY